MRVVRGSVRVRDRQAMWVQNQISKTDGNESESKGKYGTKYIRPREPIMEI